MAGVTAGEHHLLIVVEVVGVDGGAVLVAWVACSEHHLVLRISLVVAGWLWLVYAQLAEVLFQVTVFLMGNRTTSSWTLSFQWPIRKTVTWKRTSAS